MGYIVNVQVVIAFVKSNLINLLKPLLKIVESSKTNYQEKSLIEKNSNLTGNAIKKAGNIEPEEAFIMRDKSHQKKTMLGSGDLTHLKTKFESKKSQNDHLPKSAYDNVIIEARIETLIPALNEINRLDALDALIDVFGEKHINHLSLLLAYGLEEQAM